MGFLTTITVYNDRWHEIEDNPVEFVEDIDKYISKGKMDRFDYALAQTKVHRTRHADDKTVYVHIGNTVIDVNPFNGEMERIRDEFPKFYNQIVDQLEYTLKKLKQKKDNDG